MKHYLSITIDQELYRELENIRGRENRSSFTQHLIILGLKTYIEKNKKETMAKTGNTPAANLVFTQHNSK